MTKLMVTVAIATTALAGCTKDEPRSTSGKPTEPTQNGKPDPAPADDPPALAIVFQADQLWIGNDQWIDVPEGADDRDVFGGHLAALGKALDEVGKAGPPEAQAVLISYGSDAVVRWRGTLGELDASRLGTQEALSSTTIDGRRQPVVMREPKAAIALAAAELQKLGGGKKTVIVVGDGYSGENLTPISAELGKAGITAKAVYLPAPDGIVEGDPTGWKKLTADVTLIERGDALATALVAAAR